MPSRRGQLLFKVIGAIVIAVGAFAGTLSILNYLQPSPPTEPIHVVESTYGLNCDGSKSSSGALNVVKPGNATADVSRACDAKASCTYTVGTQTAGGSDPANGCGKDFTIKWQCGQNTEINHASLPGEAILKSVAIACPQ
jgi:hypothetical protein